MHYFHSTTFVQTSIPHQHHSFATLSLSSSCSSFSNIPHFSVHTCSSSHRPRPQSVFIQALFGSSTPKPNDNNPQERKFQKNPYRELGVPESATYEQVEAAYKLLCQKYKDDRKKLIKLEVYREKIMEDSLRKRISGEVKFVPPKKKKQKKQPFKMPFMLDWTFQPPDKAYLKKPLFMAAAFAFVLLFAPQMNPYVAIMGTITSTSILYDRGLPPVVRDEFGMAGEVRRTKWNLYLKATLIIATFVLAAFLLATAAINYIPLVTQYFPPDLFLQFSLLIAGTFATCFFKVQAD